MSRLDGHVGVREHRAFRRKKDAAARPKKVARGLMSFFKRGLRRIQTCLQAICGLPNSGQSGGLDEW